MRKRPSLSLRRRLCNGGAAAALWISALLCCALLLLKKHKRPCAAQWYGKVATVMFYVSVAAIVTMDGLGLAQPHTINLWAYGLLGATGLMMAYAAFRYFQIFLSILRDGEEEKKPQAPRGR